MSQPFEQPASELRRVFAAMALLAVFALIVATLKGCPGDRNLSLLFPGPQPDWSPKRVIPRASEAVVEGKMSVDLFISTRDVSTSRKIALLRQSTDFRKGRSSAKPDMVVVVYWADGVKCRWRDNHPIYDYVSATGELGRGDEWCKVPEEFRLWILSVKKAHPLKPSYTRHIGGQDVSSLSVEQRPPLGRVRAVHRTHVFEVLDYKPGMPQEIWPTPWGTVGYEVQFTDGTRGPNTSHWQKLFVAGMTKIHRWPSSSVGKTVYYRFRWKFADGIDGPWSKPVSAKVLP